MKIVLVTVSTLDGKLTRGNSGNIYEWSSPEDFSHFQNVKSQNSLLVMGSGTFLKVHTIERAGLKAETERLRIVLTRNPKKYARFSVPGQIEFSSEKPQALVNRLEKNGYKKMLLVSGGRVAAAFFKDNLIDELWLTLEPLIFGLGEQLVAQSLLDIHCRLMSVKRLNRQGTLLLKYTRIKN